MRRAVVLLLLLFAPSAAAAAPEGGRLIATTSTGDTPQPAKAHAAAANSVTIKDFSFGPGSITVHVGDTVTWFNRGPSDHTATGRGFDSGTLKKGQSASHTFSSAGTFSYICSIHPFMKGTVVVAAAATSAPSGNSSSAAPRSASTPAAPAQSAPAPKPAKPGLPATGFDTGWLALSGALLLGAGLMLRRRTA